jgi:hypothetical protein
VVECAFIEGERELCTGYLSLAGICEEEQREKRVRNKDHLQV